jgi:hypothetical protein
MAAVHKAELDSDRNKPDTAAHRRTAAMTAKRASAAVHKHIEEEPPHMLETHFATAPAQKG